MALVKCPKCKNEISDNVRVCPACGYKYKLNRTIKESIQYVLEHKLTTAMAIGVLAIVISVLILIFGGVKNLISDKKATDARNTASGITISSLEEIVGCELESDGTVPLSVQENVDIENTVICNITGTLTLSKSNTKIITVKWTSEENSCSEDRCIEVLEFLQDIYGEHSVLDNIDNKSSSGYDMVILQGRTMRWTAEKCYVDCTYELQNETLTIEWSEK